MSGQRKYRAFTAQQKLEIVLAGLRGDVSVKELCRRHEVVETLCFSWREKLLEGGREALAGRQERQGERELKQRIRELGRTFGKKTYELDLLLALNQTGRGAEVLAHAADLAERAAAVDNRVVGELCAVVEAGRYRLRLEPEGGIEELESARRPGPARVRGRTRERLQALREQTPT